MNLWFRCFLLLLLYVPLLPAQSPVPVDWLTSPLPAPGRTALHSAKTHAFWTPPNCLTLKWNGGWDSSMVNYYQYSPAGELVQDSICIWSAAGWQPFQRVRYVWDTLGYLNARTQYEYDTAGFYPSLREESAYDTAGNQTWSLLARYNRAATVWDTLSAQQALISYGPSGKPLEALYYVLDPPAHSWVHNGRVRMVYDAQDRVVSQTQDAYSGGNYLPQYRILWAYGPGGELESRTEQVHPDTSWVNDTHIRWLSWHDANLGQQDSSFVLRWDTLAWDTTDFFRYAWSAYASYEYTQHLVTDTGRVNFKRERMLYDSHHYPLREEMYAWDAPVWAYAFARHHTVLYGTDGYPQVDSVAAIPMMSMLSSPVPDKKFIYGVEMVAVRPPVARGTLLAWPNPAAGDVAVRMPAVPGQWTVTLSHVLGQAVGQWECRDQLDLELEGVPAGLYLLTARWADQCLQTRLVVQ